MVLCGCYGYLRRVLYRRILHLKVLVSVVAKSCFLAFGDERNFFNRKNRMKHEFGQGQSCDGIFRGIAPRVSMIPIISDDEPGFVYELNHYSRCPDEASADYRPNRTVRLL